MANMNQDKQTQSPQKNKTTPISNPGKSIDDDAMDLDAEDEADELEADDADLESDIEADEDAEAGISARTENPSEKRGSKGSCGC